MKYEVYFSGKAYVEADDVTDAVAAFDEDDFICKEIEVTGVAKVDKSTLEV